MATAVFVGLATLDIAYAVRRYPAEDSKTQAEDQFLGAGGPAANAAVAYAFLSGRDPALITALGEHQLAQAIRRDLERFGVAPVDVTPAGTQRPPVSSIVVATESGTRTIVSLDGSRVSAPFDPGALESLHDAAVVLVDGHYPEPALGFAAAARESGITVVLDAGRWRSVHAELLPLVDVAICSAAFAPPGTSGTPAEVFDDLHARGVHRVAITQGDKPIRYSEIASNHHPARPDAESAQHAHTTPREQVRSPSERETEAAHVGEIAVPRTQAVDTLGAGDILHGAFCHYYAAGQSFPDALRAAAAVATASCAYLGTREWMRHHPRPDQSTR
ncbi:PfkB family carbohydrate kinase [Nocardia wallacei]|uniref:Kinase n=1 Tax=Nocardia wallacei TaxID=480035 RepID=A0A7G1KBU5_9NOCA|nr:PfkB family carbohydrate kinase [Nocardia wallacei]BCK52638.1 kinase [Nocardia wallacei]